MEKHNKCSCLRAHWMVWWLWMLCESFAVTFSVTSQTNEFCSKMTKSGFSFTFCFPPFLSGLHTSAHFFVTFFNQLTCLYIEKNKFKDQWVIFFYQLCDQPQSAVYTDGLSFILVTASISNWSNLVHCWATDPAVTFCATGTILLQAYVHIKHVLTINYSTISTAMWIKRNQFTQFHEKSHS